MKQSNLRRDIWLALAVSAGLLLLAFLTIRFTYEANDDLAMAAILNGSYTGTPDGHAIYLKYPLSWLIALLYRTGIQVSWYQFTMTGAYLLAIASVCFRLLRRLPSHPALACALTTGGVALLWLCNIMRFTFSTCGAFMAASVVLCYALQTREEDLQPGYLANILVLFWLTYTIRDFFCYAALAFLGVVWLSKYGKVMLRQRQCWLIPLAALLVLGSSAAIHKLAYQGWEEFWAYNLDRVYLQDYERFPDYQTHQAFLEGIGFDAAEYYTVSHYDYSLLESFGPEDIHQIADYVKSTTPVPSPLSEAKRSLKQAADYYFVDDWEQLKPLQAASYLLPLALLVLSLVWSVKDKRWHILFSGLLLFGMGCCYLFIGYRGRYPDRVSASLRILVIGASLAGLAVLLMAHPVSLRKETLRRGLALGATALLLAATLWGFSTARTSLGAPQQAGMDYVSYIAQHPENIYIRDTRSTQYKKDRLAEYPKVSPNVIATGSWSTFSPLYYEKLERMGLEQLNRDTLLLDNAYLVVREKYPLHQVLGLSQEAVVDFTVIERFEGGIQILKIHDIQP